MTLRAKLRTTQSARHKGQLNRLHEVDTMQVIQTLEAKGFDVRLVRADGIERVEAHRTERTEITPKAAGAWLLQLSREQDAAVAYMRRRAVCAPNEIIDRRTELYRTIKTGLLCEDEEARAIAEFNLEMGIKVASDGTPWLELLTP
jgi:hypothetical protein